MVVINELMLFTYFKKKKKLRSGTDAWIQQE